MKILLYADPHWSAYSSIVRKRGNKYSQRLENLVKSLTWAENLSIEKCCDKIACLGDFFDKSDLGAEEITALNDVTWNKNIPHYFVVGNHEMASSDLTCSSAHLFNLENFSVISSVCDIDCDGTQVVFIPYILESNRKPFSEYVKRNGKKTIVLSHNDLQIQYGMYKSESGFTVDEIESACDLFVNGHLHNGESITDKIINLGNLTGQNFSEDASTYRHCVLILDTETLKYEMVENPYAFNFYKLNVDENFDSSVKSLKQNAVITVKVREELYDSVRERLSGQANIVESRFIIEREVVVGPESDISELAGDDHLQQFNTYILSTLGCSDVITAELAEVCK